MSRDFNKGICRQYDTIVKRVAQQAENTEELVQMQNYVENLKVGELLQLKVGNLWMGRSSHSVNERESQIPVDVWNILDLLEIVR